MARETALWEATTDWPNVGDFSEVKIWREMRCLLGMVMVPRWWHKQTTVQPRGRTFDDTIMKHHLMQCSCLHALVPSTASVSLQSVYVDHCSVHGGFYCLRHIWYWLAATDIIKIMIEIPPFKKFNEALWYVRLRRPELTSWQNKFGIDQTTRVVDDNLDSESNETFASMAEFIEKHDIRPAIMRTFD